MCCSACWLIELEQLVLCGLWNCHLAGAVLVGVANFHVLGVSMGVLWSNLLCVLWGLTIWVQLCSPVVWLYGSGGVVCGGGTCVCVLR